MLLEVEAVVLKQSGMNSFYAIVTRSGCQTMFWVGYALKALVIQGVQATVNTFNACNFCKNARCK